MIQDNHQLVQALPFKRKLTDPQGLSESNVVDCPYCMSSTHVIRKGFRYDMSGYVQLYFCKSCKRRFRENARKAKELTDDLAATYMFGVQSLESLLETKRDLKLSRTTLYRRIRVQARDCPGWEDLLKAEKGQENWGSVMGIDTTGLKIRGAVYVYIHIADVMSRDPLAYAICRREDAATIEPMLQKLKNLGYSPKVVVSDLAPEILFSVKNVFPNAILQGCVFHVSLWLNKELPTKKTIKKVGKEKTVLWRKVKDVINYACISKNESTKQQYLEQLKSLPLDEKARSVVERFLDHLKYYHTKDEFKGYSTNILYNNACERHVGMIKDLKRKFRGFKSNIDATNDIIKLFWFLKRKSPTRFQEKEGDALAYYMPLTSFCDCVNVPELSKASGISKEFLVTTANRMGRTVIGDYAFAENKLDDIKKSILKMGKTSLDAVMQKIEFDQTTTMELLDKFRIGLVFKSLRASDIMISPARRE